MIRSQGGVQFEVYDIQLQYNAISGSHDWRAIVRLVGGWRLTFWSPMHTATVNPPTHDWTVPTSHSSVYRTRYIQYIARWRHRHSHTGYTDSPTGILVRCIHHQSLRLYQWSTVALAVVVVEVSGGWHQET